MLSEHLLTQRGPADWDVCLVQELILVGLTNGAEGLNSKPQCSLAESELDLLSQA